MLKKAPPAQPKPPASYFFVTKRAQIDSAREGNRRFALVW